MATILPWIWKLCIWHIQFEIRDELLQLFPETVFSVIKFGIFYMQEAGKVLKKGKKEKHPVNTAIEQIKQMLVSLRVNER